MFFCFFAVGCGQQSAGGGGGGGGGGGTTEPTAPISWEVSQVNFAADTGSISFAAFVTSNEAILIFSSQPPSVSSTLRTFTYEATVTTAEGVTQRSLGISSAAIQTMSADLLSRLRQKTERQERLSEIMRQRERENFQRLGRPRHPSDDLHQAYKVSACDISIGATQEFYVYNFDTTGYDTATAEVAGIGDHCYVYVEQGLSISADSVSQLINEFDNNVYDKMHTYFGEEPNPGIDNDAKITLLFLDLGSSLYGYFDSLQEYSTTNSNQREMLFLNGTSQYLALPVMAPTMMHEFQHMVNFNNKTLIQGVTEDTWLNEGLSVYSEQVAGYGLPAADYFCYSKVYTYENATNTSPLTIWGPSYGYGSSYLFVLYLAERYGAAAIRTLETNNQTGTANVENASGRTFAQIFNSWIIANYLDGLIAENADNAGYYYSTINLRGTYELGGAYGSQTLPGVNCEAVSSYPYSGSGTFKSWAPYYAALAAPGTSTSTVEVSITGGASSYISAEAVYGNVY
ncbi:MAG: hypothetical protein WC901_07650 [Candidatus Margulisiibacteriota bacterium]